jgi:hypothetical protein
VNTDFLDLKLQWAEVFNDGETVITAAKVWGGVCLLRINGGDPYPVSGLKVIPKEGDMDRPRLVPITTPGR